LGDAQLVGEPPFGKQKRFTKGLQVRRAYLSPSSLPRLSLIFTAVQVRRALPTPQRLPSSPLSLSLSLSLSCALFLIQYGEVKRTYEVVEENGVKSYRLEDIPQYALLYEELKEGLYLEASDEASDEGSEKVKSRRRKPL